MDTLLKAFETPLVGLALAEGGSAVPAVVKHLGRLEVEPQRFRAHVGVGLRAELRRAPPPQEGVVRRMRIPRHNHPARQRRELRQQRLVVRRAVFVPVDARLPARLGVVGRVHVDQLVPLEHMPREEILRATMNELDGGKGQIAPARDDPFVGVDGDRTRRRQLVAQDRATADMRLDVHPVRRHQVDDVLVRLALAAWILHAADHRQK
ncbi:hypothetical protein [Roseateles chitinivorans]|uniref:hypothetical protein n=1 Tax=Roseateles chitinivorans TaxID=2917965 RepID=UPI003D668428